MINEILTLPNNIMHEQHPDFDRFMDILRSQKYCNLTIDDDHKTHWYCNNTFNNSVDILVHHFPSINIDSTITYFESASCFCDCEVLFNLDPYCKRLIKRKEGQVCHIEHDGITKDLKHLMHFMQKGYGEAFPLFTNVVCDKCFKVLSLYNGYGKIHQAHCGGNLIHIDELLLDIVSKFWRLGIKTYYSCAGHLYHTPGERFSPYITFDASITKQITNLIDTPKYKDFWINTEVHTITGKYQTTIYAINDDYVSVLKLTSLQKMEIQKVFIEFLYTLYKILGGSDDT